MIEITFSEHETRMMSHGGSFTLRGEKGESGNVGRKVKYLQHILQHISH